MKMMVVGAARKGKTTLLSLLLNEKIKSDNQATLGVNVKKWTYVWRNCLVLFVLCASSYQHRPGVMYNINCWDFAGQKEFYSTHQCFLTRRSLYLVSMQSLCVCVFEDVCVCACAHCVRV